jgi:mannose-6-phosphate isomerase-like protein (cupin superfamily)
MSFIDTNGIENGTLLGAEHGATRVFIFRGRRVPPGPVAAPHRHRGDEAIRVVRGRLRVRVGAETRVIGPGEIACIPPHTDHAFIVVDEADVEVFGEQRMGEFVTVQDADGSEHDEEIFMREFPWSRVPPSDDAYTPLAELLARYGEWHRANRL